MHYLIDGYNLFFRIATEIDPLEKNRTLIIAFINQHIAKTRLTVTVIFDSQTEHASLFPSRHSLSSLEVVYSPKNQTADDYILEYLEARKHPQQFTVITSDKALANKARELHAKTLSIEKFISWLEKKELTIPHETKQEKETKAEFKRLLDIFEKKLGEK